MTGAEIRDLRRRAGDLSQRKFAGLLGVTPRTVQKWEAGEKPAPSHFKLLNQLQTFYPKKP